MRIIALATLTRRIVANRRRLLITMAVTVLFMLALFGRKLLNKDAASALYNSELEAFNQDVSEQEASIEAQRERVEVQEKEVADLKDYCEKSIYMQLPEAGFYCGEVQYAITECETTQLVLDGYITFLSSTEFRNKLANNTGVDEGMLRDVISYDCYNNILRLYIYHYDENTANELLTEADKIVRSQVNTVKKTQGDFSISEFSRNVGLRTDINITYAQLGKLNDYKSYNTDLTSEKNRLSDMEQELTSFIEENQPVNSTISGGKAIIKQVLIYACIGVLLGIVVLFMWELFIALYWGKLYSDDYCRELKLDCHELIKSSSDVKSLSDKAQKLITDLEISLNKDNKNQLFIVLAQVTNASNMVATYIAEELDKKGIKANFGSLYEDDSEVLLDFSSSDSVILLVERGQATYKRIDYYCSISNRYKLNNLGYFEWINTDKVLK